MITSSAVKDNLGSIYHRGCFTCAVCEHELAGKKYINRDSERYCKDCFDSHKAPLCCKCENRIKSDGNFQLSSHQCKKKQKVGCSHSQLHKMGFSPILGAFLGKQGEKFLCHIIKDLLLVTQNPNEFFRSKLFKKELKNSNFVPKSLPAAQKVLQKKDNFADFELNLSK